MSKPRGGSLGQGLLRTFKHCRPDVFGPFPASLPRRDRRECVLMSPYILSRTRQKQRPRRLRICVFDFRERVRCGVIITAYNQCGLPRSKRRVWSVSDRLLGAMPSVVLSVRFLMALIAAVVRQCASHFSLSLLFPLSLAAEGVFPPR